MRGKKKSSSNKFTNRPKKATFIFYSIWSTVAVLPFCFFRFWTLRFNLFKHVVMLAVATVFFSVAVVVPFCFFVCALRFSESWKPSINLFFVPSCQSVTLGPRASKRNAVLCGQHRNLAFRIESRFDDANRFGMFAKARAQWIWLFYIQWFSISLNCCDACASVIHTSHTTPCPTARFFQCWLPFKKAYKHNSSTCVSLRTQFHSYSIIKTNSSERKNAPNGRTESHTWCIS